MAICGAALLTTSCSQDDDLTAGSASRVTITVNSPELSTRSDGSAATQLQYLLYDIQVDGFKVLCGDPVKTGVSTFPFTLEDLDVVTGHNYGILLWASESGSPYSVDWKEGTLTVDYDEATANSETLDAFYAYETFTVEGSVNLNVTMTRPFAMINIGTTKNPEKDATSTISVTGVPESLNLITGELSETNTEAITFPYAAVPTGIGYPIEGYNYLSFAYVLAPKEGAQSTITYFYKVGEGEPISASAENITLKANYKVNIYGDLPLSANN